MKMSKSIVGWRLHMLSGGYSTVTIKGYIPMINRVINYLNDPEAGDVTIWDLEAFLASLRETGVKEATRQEYWKVIKSYFKWAAMDKGLGIKRPDRELQMPKVPEPEILPYTELEIKSLLKACEQTAMSKPESRKPCCFDRKTADRDKLMILVMLDTGVRVSELCRIQYKDIDLTEQSIVIRPFETGGKSRGRTVYLGSVAMEYLWKMVVENDDPENYLFCSSKTKRNKSIDRFAVNNLLKGLGEKAGIKNVGAHRFRHTFAIQYLRNGGDVYTLKRLIGHKSFYMVQRYLQLSDVDSKVAHRKASPVDNWI